MCNSVFEFFVFSCVLFIAILVSVNYYKFDETVYKIVETRNGAVRGILNKTIFNQKPFYSFRGIPFAEPPIAELRFKVLVYRCLNNNFFLKYKLFFSHQNLPNHGDHEL